MAFLILLTLCQCAIKVSSNDAEIAELPNDAISEKSNTLSFCTYNAISQDFTDTTLQYSIKHRPENNRFIYESLKLNWQREVVYDSIGIRQLRFWQKGVIKENILLQYDKNGKIRKIEKYIAENDSLESSSVEEYSYSGGLLEALYYKDYQKIGNRKFLRESITSYRYDDLGRIATSTVRRIQDKRDQVADTVKYFYEGPANLPYEVHRKLESGAKYYIDSQLNTLKIEKVMPYEDGYYIQTDSLIFDDNRRVVEYFTNERLDPQRFPHSYYKYEISYPSDSNLTRVPNLVFAFKPSFPKRSISAFMESIVNPGCYRDASIRTDIDYYLIPRTILSYRSDDAKDWTLRSKLVLHE